MPDKGALTDSLPPLPNEPQEGGAFQGYHHRASLGGISAGRMRGIRFRRPPKKRRGKGGRHRNRWIGSPRDINPTMKVGKGEFSDG